MSTHSTISICVYNIYAHTLTFASNFSPISQYSSQLFLTNNLNPFLAARSYFTQYMISHLFHVSKFLDTPITSLSQRLPTPWAVSLANVWFGSSINFSFIILLLLLCVFVWVYGGGSEDESGGFYSLPPLFCGFWGLNSDYKVTGQAPLPTEPSLVQLS